MANQAEAAPVRGLLLIGVAVLIGALFLSKGFDNGGVTVSADDLSSSDTTVPVGAGSGTATTDPLLSDPTAHPIETLQVLVVNVSGVSGAAGAVTETLKGFGYAAAIPPSGSAPTIADTTLVYYYADETNSYQADAEAVALALGLQETQVQQLPADSAATLGIDIGTAVVVVMLGVDLAPPPRAEPSGMARSE